MHSLPGCLTREEQPKARPERDGTDGRSQLGVPILVVGAINVDLVVGVSSLPGPGETVVGPDLARHGGGKGANAAVAAARAGASVRLIGAVGADDFGEVALAELRSEGIAVGDVAILEGKSTGVALIVVAANGENQVAVAAGANLGLDATAVRLAVERAGGWARAMIVSTEIAGSAVVAAVEAATRIGVPCVLNPAPVVTEVIGLLGDRPILTPNASECVALAAALDQLRPSTGRSVGARGAVRAVNADHDDVAEAAVLIANRSGAPVVVTLGAEGALIAEAGGELELVGPRPSTVVDTTGAGDTFSGVLATRIGAGESLPAAVRAATAAASLSVSHAGARHGMPGGAAIEMALLEMSEEMSRHPKKKS